MEKWVLIVIVSILIAVVEVSATTVSAASCSYSDVSSAVNSANPEDTVIVPGNCNWDSTLTITRGIRLVGGPATIQGGGLEYAPDATARSNDEAFEVSGFTFDGGGITLTSLDFDNPITKVQIFDNTFRDGGVAILHDGNIWGVAYHNVFDSRSITIRSQSTSGRDAQEMWNQLSCNYGEGDNFFLEDNTIIMPDNAYITYGQDAGRFAVRYNDISIDGGSSHDNPFDAHGNRESGDCVYFGTMIHEVYGNDISADGTFDMTQLRGGRAMFVWNRITGSDGYWKVRQEFGDGACVISGECVQTVNDVYFINNRNDGGLVDPYESGDCCDDIAENEQWWEHDSNFDGTSGVGCGTLANRPITCDGENEGYWATNQDCSQVSTDNVGRDASVPIDGTLYRCISTDTWVAYYAPLQYPHPLRDDITYECSDTIDNDGDGQTDYPNDTGCTDANDNDESDCNDGNCEGTEDCNNCEPDCGACGPTCGDGTCDNNEDCSICEADCGACCVPMTTAELVMEIDRWKRGEINIEELMEAIATWKSGC